MLLATIATVVSERTRCFSQPALTFDPTFKPNLSSRSVNDLRLQSDGKILLSLCEPLGQCFPVRLNVDGSLDSSFSPSPEATAYQLELQPNGKIIIFGWFRSLEGEPREFGIARLHGDGKLDRSYVPRLALTTNETVLRHAIQNDNKLIVEVANRRADASGVVRGYLVRLNEDGSLDSGFSAELESQIEIRALAVQMNNKVLVSTGNHLLDGRIRSELIRLKSDGRRDESFPPWEAEVFQIMVLADGKVMIVGSLPDERWAMRLKPDGTLDRNYYRRDVGDCGVVDGLGAILPDGTMFVRMYSVKTYCQQGIRRLKANGTLDPSFDHSGVGFAQGVVLGSDESVIFAGNGLARMVQAAVFRVPALTPDKRFAATLGVRANRAYRLEASTDLLTWSPLTNVNTASESVPFIDPEAASQPRRYYRAIEVRQQ